MLGHEINRFRSDVICSQHQIPLILTIFFVDKDHHFAGAEVGNDFFGGG
jgi:hypothetical protein